MSLLRPNIHPRNVISKYLTIIRKIITSVDNANCENKDKSRALTNVRNLTKSSLSLLENIKMLSENAFKIIINKSGKSIIRLLNNSSDALRENSDFWKK